MADLNNSGCMKNNTIIYENIIKREGFHPPTGLDVNFSGEFSVKAQTEVFQSPNSGWNDQK